MLQGLPSYHRPTRSFATFSSCLASLSAEVMFNMIRPDGSFNFFSQLMWQSLQLTVHARVKAIPFLPTELK
jgi:hypothetical protein